MATTAPAPVLHTAMAATLGHEIVEGTLRPGDTLTLEAIGERFRTSRTVAREVVRALEQLRLVTSKRRVGVVVRPAADWDVFDPTLIGWRLHSSDRAAQLRSLTALRTAVEPEAAAGAARYADPVVRRTIVPLAARMRLLGEAGDLAAFLVADQKFHATLLRSSGNEMFAALSDVVATVLAGRTELGMMPEHPEPAALDAHEEVARAVAAGRPDDARAAMARITAEVRQAVVDPAG